MKFCSKCGKEILEEAIICPHCGCAVAGAPVEDKVNIGFCVLAALIPLFGIIYWPVMHSKKPKGATAVGITALVAWAVYIVITLFL